MSIITIISHKPKSTGGTTALTEQRREFDTIDEGIEYLKALRDQSDGESES